MPDLSEPLLLQTEGEAVEPLCDRIVFGIEAMQQIIVKVFESGAVELLLKDARHILLRFQREGRQLIRDEELLPRVALNDCFSQHFLGFPAVIDIGGVKISKACCKECICHFADLFLVKRSRIICIQ